MEENVVGKIPEFTSGETEETGKEVKEAITKEVIEKEKETPTEPPTDIKPAPEKPSGSDDVGQLLKQVQGLAAEKEKLLKEIQELRGARRELKQAELSKVEQKIDELKDLHPDDVAVIEKVLRAKGYITKEEADRMLYDRIKQEELDRFLEKYPEYKPENDPNDINWNALQRELSYYRMPQDPRQIREILERAHRAIQKPGDRGIAEKQQKLDTAGVGGGGIQRSSSKKSLSPAYREALLRGGWSEEEIKKIEEKLP